MSDRLARLARSTRNQMNYFGHVALAAEFSLCPEFLFGAILPDLAGIIGCPKPECAHAHVQRGVDFHLATDHEFHQTEVFRTHVSRACRQLESAGMRRAPARAVSHVAFELLLDAELGKVPIHGTAFRMALRVAGPTGVGGTLAWSSLHAAERFESLRLRLIERSTCRDFFAKDRLVDRLVYALRARPRLRMFAVERDLLCEWIHGHSIPSPDELASVWVSVRERVADCWQTHQPPCPHPTTLANRAAEPATD